MKITFANQKPVAKDTKIFFFKRPANFTYLPGQFVYLTLPSVSGKDPKGPTRMFTLSSSPTEKNFISITTRVRKDSLFKKALNNLKLGELVNTEGPSGTFIIDKKEKGPHVFLAGGIGITPFRSFTKYNIDQKLKSIKLHLIYANSTPEDITFRKEFEKWSEHHENIKTAITVSRRGNSKKNWSGLTGRVNEQMIKKLIGNWKLPLARARGKGGNLNYWVCGPPGFVSAMETILLSMGVPSKNIRQERFTGY